MNIPVFWRRTGASAHIWFALALVVFASMPARAQDPKEVVLAAVEKLKAAAGYTWTLTATPGADDGSPRYFAFPIIHGKTAGEVVYASARADVGEVVLVRKGGRKAARIKNQWKTPEEFRAEWLKANAAASAANAPAAPGSAQPPAPANPVDLAGYFLGNDPTAVIGGLAPMPVTTRMRGGRAVIKAPPPGATLRADSSNLAPVAELPGMGGMTVMALDAAPDPLAEIEAILASATKYKLVGPGNYTAEVSPDFAKALAGERKLVGDSRAPQMTDSKLTARFWAGIPSMVKAQVVIQTTMIVGPPYNPLEFYVDRTLTIEAHVAALPRVDIPAAAGKLLE